MKELTDEQLIRLFKENNCSLKDIEEKYNLRKDSISRLFNKRGINLNLIRKEYQKELEDLNPFLSLLWLE